MSDRTVRALVRFYPRAWRDRYGDELADLIRLASDDRAPTLRLWLDVAGEGLRQRLIVIGILGDHMTRSDRARSGVVAVMWSWMLFCLGGIGVQKASEHWQQAVPARNVHIPDIAFAALVIGAMTGVGLVVAGVAVGARSLISYLQGGGWPQIRSAIYRAVITTGFTVLGLVGVAIWAHHLTGAQRNGHDDMYAVAVVGWVLLLAVCVFTWAAAASMTLRHLDLSARLVRVESCVAVAVTSTMAAMTVATSVWWANVADTSPWFFAGTPRHTTGTVIPANLVIPAAVMAVATVVGTIGSYKSLRNSRLGS